MSSSSHFSGFHSSSVSLQEGDAGALSYGVLWVAAAAVVSALLFVGGQAWLQQGWLGRGPANDFLAFYSAAGAEDAYSAAALDAARPQGFDAAAHTTRPYLRLPFHAVLLRPLRALPYASAYLLWQVLMLWCVAGFVAWWRPPAASVSLLAVAISVPLFFAFMRGQDTPFLLLAAAGCLHSIAGNHPFRAGLWLSALAVQPHALLAAPIVLIAQRRWMALKGLAAGLLGLAVVSFAAGGWDWPWRLADAWRASAPVSAAAMPSLAGAAAWLGLDSLAVYPAAVMLLLAVYAVACRESFAAALGCALAAGLLLAPRAHFEDCGLLLPGALVLFAEKQSWPVRLTAALALTPLGYLVQGGREAAPAVVALSAALVLLAGALPSRQSRTFRRRQLLVQLGLG